MKIYLISALSLLLLIINFAIKSKHPIIKSITCTFSGLVTLFFDHAKSIFTGKTLPLNILTLSFSALLGVPGVGTLTVLISLFNTVSI